MRYFKKHEAEKRWLAAKEWSFPSGLNPGCEQELERRKSNKPLSDELKKKRWEHMCELRKEGASYALIGRLYELDRSLVRKIIKETHEV